MRIADTRRRRRRLETVVLRAWRLFLGAQRARVLAAFDGLPVELAIRERAPKRRRVRWVDAIFDTRAEGEFARQAMLPPLRACLGAAIDATVESLRWDSPTFSVFDPRCSQWLAKEKGADYWRRGPNARTINAIHQAVAAGLEEGASWRELRGLIADVFEAARGPRATRIAITEAGSAYEAGAHLTADAFSADTGGAVLKYWQATLDRLTRESHRVAGVRNGWIPEDAVFEVGKSRLLYPGDPNGPAEETVFCRCTLSRRIARVSRTSKRIAQ